MIKGQAPLQIRAAYPLLPTRSHPKRSGRRRPTTLTARSLPVRRKPSRRLMPERSQQRWCLAAEYLYPGPRKRAFLSVNARVSDVRAGEDVSIIRATGSVKGGGRLLRIPRSSSSEHQGRQHQCVKINSPLKASWFAHGTGAVIARALLMLRFRTLRPLKAVPGAGTPPKWSYLGGSPARLRFCWPRSP